MSGAGSRGGSDEYDRNNRPRACIASGGRGTSMLSWRPLTWMAALLWLVASGPLQAQSFRVEDIRLEGLQRISAGTVFNYLPMKVGDTIDAAGTAEAIRALYKTGFFKDVRIERDGTTLVVALVERPSIASIEFSGNKDLSSEDLRKSLEDIGFIEGRSFNQQIFDQVEQELRKSYFASGKYGVRIEGTATPLERNRVAVNFDIVEGKVARIRQINLVGNEAFDDGELLDLFKLQPRSTFSFITRSDRYSKQKLAADLEALRSHYLDLGFINFNIDSTQVSITADKRDVYITINVTEGDRFTVDEVKLAGDFVVPKEQLFDRVTVVQGAVFSRKEVTATSAALTSRLGDDGYAFANVNAIPDIDESGRRVSLTFFIDPGKRVYVRRINFKGNTRTRDEVLRREMRQIEGGWISTGAVERSKSRLQRLDYFEEVNVETPAVAGTTDQVDVEFAVVEKPSGNLSIGAGLSQDQGVIFNSSLNQENFFGTGNRVSASFNNSKVNRNFAFNWLNPYYTIDGVSRGFDLHYRRTNASDANLADYDLDQLGGNVSFGIPISEFNTVNVALNAEHTDFKLGDNPSTEVIAFDRSVGGSYDAVFLSGSWASDTRDSRLLPSTGSLSRISGEVAIPGIDLEYYKASLKHQRFFPLPASLALKVEGEVGFGGGYGNTGDLPLTENFFAGGIHSVRGYKANTLGPRDSKNEPLGGDLMFVGGAEILVPIPFLRDSRSVRVTTFYDTGNVWGSGQSFALGSLRHSVGVSALWLSPLGPLTVSFAEPFGDQSGDEMQRFQFTFGTSF